MVRHLQNIDDLSVLSGHDYVINDVIKIKQPKLSEIIDFGEDNYNALVGMLTANPSDMKSILWDAGVDYTKITSFALFVMFAPNFNLDKTRILFGDLDFSQLRLRKHNGFDALCDIRQGVYIDESIFMLIQNFILRSNCIKKKIEIPGNENTKMVLIDWDREDRQAAKRKKHRSQLFPYISAMVNHPGFKYNYQTVQDLTMFQFMDAVVRIPMIASSSSLLQGLYSNPYLDSSKIDKTQLNWLRETS